jgi:hypothetical protein
MRDGSPLQVSYGNGYIIAGGNDVDETRPTALIPFKAPPSAYEVSLDGHPAVGLGDGGTWRWG